MTYSFNHFQFIENGPAALAARVRARRAALDAFYLTEKDRLEDAETVIGTSFKHAA